MDLLSMSDLQISLIIIGIFIIIGVAIFNWVQQTRLRRKIESTLDHEHNDALLEPSHKSQSNEPHTRIEPQLDKDFFSSHYDQKETDTLTVESNTATEQGVQFDSKPDNEPDSDLEASEDKLETPIPVLQEQLEEFDETYDSYSNYIITIRSDTAISDEELNQLLQRKYDFEKPVIWLGKKEESTIWDEITAELVTDNSGFSGLKGCLLLADRSGPISEIDLSKFRDIMQDFAANIHASIECPDIMSTHEQAIILDKFCAEVDVMIGINIISKDGGAFVGTKIRALAEASGFNLDSDGVFKYRNENDHVQFTLSNQESDAFLPDRMKSITTHGITFLLDVPRVANGEKVFDQMVHLAKIFANTLGGIMVDDNRIPLSESGFTRSKQQLANIQSSMKENNIVAGGTNALRLFN